MSCSLALLFYYFPKESYVFKCVFLTCDLCPLINHRIAYNFIARSPFEPCAIIIMGTQRETKAKAKGKAVNPGTLSVWTLQVLRSLDDFIAGHVKRGDNSKVFLRLCRRNKNVLLLSSLALALTRSCRNRNKVSKSLCDLPPLCTWVWNSKTDQDSDSDRGWLISALLCYCNA